MHTLLQHNIMQVPYRLELVCSNIVVQSTGSHTIEDQVNNKAIIMKVWPIAAFVISAGCPTDLCSNQCYVGSISWEELMAAAEGSAFHSWQWRNLGTLSVGGGIRNSCCAVNTSLICNRASWVLSVCASISIVFRTNLFGVERGSSVVECRTRNQVSPGSNPSLLPFRGLGIFVLSIDAPVHSAV